MLFCNLVLKCREPACFGISSVDHFDDYVAELDEAAGCSEVLSVALTDHGGCVLCSAVFFVAEPGEHIALGLCLFDDLGFVGE